MAVYIQLNETSILTYVLMGGSVVVWFFVAMLVLVASKCLLIEALFHLYLVVGLICDDAVLWINSKCACAQTLLFVLISKDALMMFQSIVYVRIISHFAFLNLSQELAVINFRGRGA